MLRACAVICAAAASRRTADASPTGAQIEKLDFAFRKKSPEKAAAALSAVSADVAAVKAAVF